ncbi:MAG: acyl-CoA dehydrogenase family protein, partial [Rhodospirillales bacterium]|nr:acyl-CoA dehydrogenase family protein [Rhodospirillales bacterium]
MSIPKLEFPPFHLPPEAEALRAEVRSFLRETLPALETEDRFSSWNTRSSDFSRALGKRGWIGITWPKQYGGSERSFLDRYVVTEELLGNGAPAGAHWVADRQSGPLLLRFGSEEQRQAILPRITAGECYFSIGMSEPDSGSDLASVRTRAEPVPGGFRVNGTKVWTSGAHRNHYCITLVRTSGQHGDRHKGLSQLLVDLKTPGITIRPIINLAGRHDWNEVTFNDCFIPESCLIGNEGDGWLQVTSELAFER